MKLVAGWRHVLRKAWSVRLPLLAGFLTGFEVALPLLGDAFPIPTDLFAFASFFIGRGFRDASCFSEGFSWSE
ncbi:hypothetical protein [Brucella pseudogrignonensis]|uniref:DUF1232 domain-containing protein n=1 Tax=Brucella pseudogrignonensis TaxID=419475 RepID=A0ABU1MG81_9HYPH|nr:hypothetical protein [Brucella pseudogrignonensis]MDR6434601.1 hypothetical protein [Brucella pseudogrignonensis]